MVIRKICWETSWCFVLCLTFSKVFTGHPVQSHPNSPNIRTWSKQKAAGIERRLSSYEARHYSLIRVCSSENITKGNWDRIPRASLSSTVPVTFLFSGHSLATIFQKKVLHFAPFSLVFIATFSWLSHCSISCGRALQWQESFLPRFRFLWPASFNILFPSYPRSSVTQDDDFDDRRPFIF